MSIASKEVRERAIAAYEAKQGTQAQIAAMYGVSVSTFERWWTRYRRTGETAPRPRGHNPCALSKADRKRLEALLDAHPDLTLAQLREVLNVRCSLVTIHNTTRRLGWRYKKIVTRQ